MSDRRSETSAVLDEMVAGIMGVKADKAAALTPVGLENASPIPSRNPVALFPNDAPGQEIAGAVFEIEHQADRLLETAAALRRLNGMPERGVPAPRVVTPAMQAAIDRHANDKPEEFGERMDRLSKEAQAATFAAKDDQPDADGWTDWTCPTHGTEDIRKAQSPKGRKYNACAVPDCKEFEKK